jgi:hypothetical protein
MPNSVFCNGEIRLSLHPWFETAPPRPIHPDCHTGLPLTPAPLDGFHQDYSSCSMALYMSRVYHPRGMVSTGMEKVLRIDRPDGRRVRKFDGLSGRGLWWRLRPWAYLRCEGSAGSRTGLWPRGLRIALRAMLIKSALRDLLFMSTVLHTVVLYNGVILDGLHGDGRFLDSASLRSK